MIAFSAACVGLQVLMLLVPIALPLIFCDDEPFVSKDQVNRSSSKAT